MKIHRAILSKASYTTSYFLGSSAANNNINGDATNPTSNGPIPSSNSLSSSATTATVTSLTNGLQQEHNYLNQNNVPNGDWICFNFGKELYTYSYRGVKKVSEREGTERASGSGYANKVMTTVSVHSDNI